MRTARALTVSASMLCTGEGAVLPGGVCFPGEGVCLQGSVCLQGGVLPGEVCASWGCVCASWGGGGSGGGVLPRGCGIPACTEADPPVNRMTGAKILPCPKLRLQAVKIHCTFHRRLVLDKDVCNRSTYNFPNT